MLSCTRDLQSCHMSHLGNQRNQELHVFFCKDVSVHFSNWGSRKPMTNWSTSTMNLSPALAFPPIGSRSLRCSIIDRTKSSSSSCAVRAKACTVCGSTVAYGKNDGDGEDAIERIKSCLSSLNRWLLKENGERFHRKVAEASRRASFIETRPTQSPKRITEMESTKSEAYSWTDKLKISRSRFGEIIHRHIQVQKSSAGTETRHQGKFEVS